MITFNTQYEKLVQAYLNNKVNPYLNCACFIGNLLNGQAQWCYGRNIKFDKDTNIAVGSTPDINYNGYREAVAIVLQESDNTYSMEDICDLETSFLRVYFDEGGRNGSIFNEDALFKAFEVTLDLLKEIHIKNNDTSIKEYNFTKRKLEHHEQL